jgi:diguanylate cyclase (GGDEF)-like protein
MRAVRLLRLQGRSFSAEYKPVESRSWLIKQGSDRERMLDMDRRLQPVRRTTFAVLAVALLAGAPWIGWWTLMPLAMAAVLFRLADDQIEHSKRPEYALFGAWAASEVIIAVSVVLSGDAAQVTYSWLAIPIVTLSARFSGRGIVVGVGMALGLLAAVAFGVNAGAVIDYPPLVLAPAALIIAVAILSTALMHSDVEHRSEAFIDQLTGLLNRNALARRTGELAQQSAVSGEPIGVVVGDLDCFKEINDTDGHAVGDAVLKEVAYLLRKRLRAFDLAYRLGGEEFLILLPGANLEQAESKAEALRQAVAEERFANNRGLTMSFGVSASARGTQFDYEIVFTEADAALYEAKRAGRDRVCLALAPATPLLA